MEQSDNYRNREQDRRLNNMETSVRTINKEMGDVNVKLAEVKSDTCWLKKSYWVIVVASVGGLVGALINLMIE